MAQLLDEGIEDAFERIEGSLSVANANLTLLGRHLLKKQLRDLLPAERGWMLEHLPSLSQELYGISDHLLALHIRLQQHASRDQLEAK